ncbi:hypothetical protein FEE95_16175 [Maribacter algarum]|uniref:DKNYY family protein n=1 Tax=Maribacter algarum (ex Zhang et al. 2020) TaxID=2578118 RepID=A0A5S3PTZ3_9FLAO|nr:DKNYY domain-containing protein [Maribacter algarum]TMM56160.1 hypothetical protein FEE95_16175 [Maribacter algarum]
MMKTLIKVFFAPLLWLAHACSPLGEPVDVEKSDNHYYNNEKSDIRYSPMGNWFELGNSPMNADVESFEVLNRFISRDRNQVYFMENPVEAGKVDLESFHIKKGDFMEHIGFDKKYVYAFEKVYSTEKTFAKFEKIEHADPKTYVRLNWDWGKDKQNHFYKNALIDVDYASFKNINDYFSKDINRVYFHYYENFESIKADLNSFEVFDEGNFAADSSKVFSVTYPSQDETKLVTIPRNPNEEISQLSYAFIQIGERVFYRGTQLKDLDYREVEIIENSSYIKDKHFVYYKDSLVQDADATTFGKISKWEIGDKNGAFREGKRIEEK